MANDQDPHKSAQSYLRGLGFREEADRWHGVIHAATDWPIQLSLSNRFPNVLPEVFIEKGFESLAHVEKNGKICIAPQTGVLLDTSKPSQLVEESLARATAVLSLTPDEHRRDRLTEFNAYWGSNSTLWSICPVPFDANEITIATLSGNPRVELAAPSYEAANEWAVLVSRQVVQTHRAFAIGLSTPVDPPPFESVLTVGEAIRKIRGHLDPGAMQALEAWFAANGLPATVIVSQPVPPDLDSAVFSATLPAPTGANAALWRNGFRPGRAPRRRQIAFASREEVQRSLVTRADPMFLAKRGGADVNLLKKKVAVVGCGAVGSTLAVLIADCGVGSLSLIDNETLEAANSFRHEIGIKDAGHPKTEALKDRINSKHPHIKIESKSSNVVTQLLQDPASFDDCSLIIVALGDETIERQINSILRARIPRVHAWLEPLGVGGHVLATGFKSSKGCYNCLFRSDDKFGLVNMASLVAPGQLFQRTFAGCAGVFTPFGSFDAHREAIEGGRIALGVLQNNRDTSALVTWVGSRTLLAAEQFQMSKRGDRLSDGSIEQTSPVRADCEVCSEW